MTVQIQRTINRTSGSPICPYSEFFVHFPFFVSNFRIQCPCSAMFCPCSEFGLNILSIFRIVCQSSGFSCPSAVEFVQIRKSNICVLSNFCVVQLFCPIFCRTFKPVQIPNFLFQIPKFLSNIQISVPNFGFCPSSENAVFYCPNSYGLVQISNFLSNKQILLSNFGAVCPSSLVHHPDFVQLLGLSKFLVQLRCTHYFERN